MTTKTLRALIPLAVVLATACGVQPGPIRYDPTGTWAGMTADNWTRYPRPGVRTLEEDTAGCGEARIALLNETVVVSGDWPAPQEPRTEGTLQIGDETIAVVMANDTAYVGGLLPVQTDLPEPYDITFVNFFTDRTMRLSYELEDAPRCHLWFELVD